LWATPARLTHPPSRPSSPAGAVDATAFNWTYTSQYEGALSVPPGAALSPSALTELPLGRLTARGPILYYADVCLYEDELHDRGHVSSRVKLRVMEDAFLLLMRCEAAPCVLMAVCVCVCVGGGGLGGWRSRPPPQGSPRAAGPSC
jgi:hypothetical protein